MLSFFKKTKLTKDLKIHLKYNHNPKEFEELLNSDLCDYIRIYSLKELKTLPANIHNEELTIVIYFYEKDYDFSFIDNWVIESFCFHHPNTQTIDISNVNIKAYSLFLSESFNEVKVNKDNFKRIR